MVPARNLAPTNAALEARLGELEQELLELRRLLAPVPESLPTAPFDVLEIRVGESWYGLPVTAIREILPMLWAEPLPEAPAWVLGSFRYGGTPVVLVDLGLRLAGSSSGFDPGRIVVLLERPLLRGFAADEVRQLRHIDPAEIAPPARGIPQAAFLLGTVVSRDQQNLLHLLSSERIGREVIFDDQGQL